MQRLFVFGNSRGLEVGEGGDGLECILQTNPPCLFWGASGAPARPYETQQHDPLLLDLLSAPTSSASDSSSPASSASSASAGLASASVTASASSSDKSGASAQVIDYDQT